MCKTKSSIYQTHAQHSRHPIIKLTRFNMFHCYLTFATARKNFDPRFESTESGSLRPHSPRNPSSVKDDYAVIFRTQRYAEILSPVVERSCLAFASHLILVTVTGIISIPCMCLGNLQLSPLRQPLPRILPSLASGKGQLCP